MDPLELHRRRLSVAVDGHGALLASAAVRGFPAAAPGLGELLEALEPLEGPVVDVTGSAGGGALAPGEADVHVLEPSYAALQAARQRFAGEPRVLVEAGLPWLAAPGRYRTALLLPPTDRGSDRVRAELAAASVALASTGTAFAAMHKDQGAKRYEREASRWFGEVSVLRRSRGWRVARLAGPRPAPSEGSPAAGPWLRFDALGRGWWARPGVFAARRVDAGTSRLLDVLAGPGSTFLCGADVLDLGCGTGILADAAVRAQAGKVTALDDDLAAVESARRNLENAPIAEVLHSDLDAALEPAASFDAALVNPPFHLGKRVRLELGHAFLEVARRRLRPGGVALVVANRALPYEDDLGSWSGFEVAAADASFKVLRAWR